MAKGRRERDRPKAAHGALYNPNKRVKLSYDSESEEEAEAGLDEQAQATVAARPGAGDARGNVAALEGIEKGGRPANAPRENEEAPEAREGEVDEGDARDQAPGDAAKSKPKLRNALTGQWHALGSLSWQDDGEEEEGDEGSGDAALEYLRSVRAERQTMPPVLSGSHTQPYEGGTEDSRGFSSDHAFIATPDAPAECQGDTPTPREAFTDALKKRFRSQSHQLHLPPASIAVAALSDKHPISYPKSNNKATLEWLRIITSIAPAPAQVRSLDEETVFRLLQLIQDRCLARQEEINRTTSAWIWSLLARLKEVGMMDNDEVYAVRAFGKKAVLVQVSFRSSEAAAHLEDLANAEVAAPVGQPEKVAHPATEEDDKQISKPGHKPADRENTLATLDTILVIVGDVFGQRDLLEFRQSWELGGDALPDG